MSGEEAGPALVLTAAELAVLEEAHRADLAGVRDAVAPEGMAPRRAPGQEEAARSLWARGLLGADGGLEVGTAAGLLAQLLLDVRLAAAGVVIAERRVQGPAGAVTAVRQAHLLGEVVVLEDVYEEGVHGLDLIPADGLVEAMVQLLVPAGAVDGAGPDRPVARERPGELPEVLGHPAVLAELTLVVPRVDGDAVTAVVVGSHLVALGQGGCYAAARAGGMVFAAVPVGWVGELVAGWQARVAGTAGSGPAGPGDGIPCEP